MSAVISTTDVCRFFGDEEETLVKAVDHVSIEIERGEFTAIVGPSGSGKTTLLHLIGGLDNPTSGSVNLSGTNIAAMSGSSRLAMFSVSILFICGGILLYFVDEKKAVQVAEDIDTQ